MLSLGDDFYPWTLRAANMVMHEIADILGPNYRFGDDIEEEVANRAIRLWEYAKTLTDFRIDHAVERDSGF